MKLNINADIAYLASQSPPIKVFPARGTAHLKYDQKSAALRAEYAKYYEFRDLPYNENMKRALLKTTNKQETQEQIEKRLFGSRVCRDKTAFFDRRIGDDVVILTKILESMIETTAEMEKFIEKVFLDAGQTELPPWDEIYADLKAESDQQLKMFAPPLAPPPKAKRPMITVSKRNAKAPAPGPSNDRKQPLASQTSSNSKPTTSKRRRSALSNNWTIFSH